MKTTNLAERIRRRRLKRRMSLSQLADRTGLNRSSIWRIEAGKRRPGLDTLELLARGLRVRLDELIGSSGARR